MPETKTVWKQGSMSTTVETVPPPELIEHIATTYLGTPGGLQYHHTSGIEKLRKIKNCYFVFLRRSGKMLGSVGYVLRDTRAGDETMRSWLVRYFSVKAPMRSEKAGKKNVKKRPVAARAYSLIKDVSHIFHDNPERLIDIDVPHVPKAVLYALVEQKNDRSGNFAEIGGYEKSGEVESFMFSRLRQRKQAGAEQLEPEAIPEMRQRLKEFYFGHAFYFDENIFLDNNYFVLREGGEIIAGLQANEESWEIRTIGNKFLDKVVKALTRLPFIGKRFRYEEMRFMGIEGIYYKEGFEEKVYQLLEGVLALKNQYLALMIMDTRAPEYMVFKKHKKLGPVHQILGSFKGDIYTRFYSYTEEDKKSIQSRPVYISIYDNT